MVPVVEKTLCISLQIHDFYCVVPSHQALQSYLAPLLAHKPGLYCNTESSVPSKQDPTTVSISIPQK